MNTKRFETALMLLKPAEWEKFERLASQFLAADFPTLVTVASPSGDEGRDAELYSPEGDASVLLQYSVAEDWRDKILRTAKRLEKTKPDARVLIYVTNQQIGAAADDLRRKLRESERFHLDIRDRNWFLERQRASVRHEAAAEELARDIIDPLLAGTASESTRAAALSGSDLQSAFMYLELQLRDDQRDRGLTKLSFDALVRSALRGTDSAHRMSRADVHDAVRRVLPSHPKDAIESHVDRALDSLPKEIVRHWKKEDSFCLSQEERERVSERLAELVQRKATLLSEIRFQLKDRLGSDYVIGTDELADLAERTRRVLEKLLLSRGEAFVAALRDGQFTSFAFDDLNDIVIRDLGERSDRSGVGARTVPLVTETTKAILLTPTGGVEAHLRSLADTYTLFSFLNETPDVQRVVQLMFSHGEIWLDTSFLLPVLLEDQLDHDEQRFSATLWAAVDAGLKLRITPGILEELERHINRSVVCARTRPSEWRAGVPFLLMGFTALGGSASEFPGWAEAFRGAARPLDDVAEYLRDEFDIEVMSVDADVQNAPKDLWHAVDEEWRRTHTTRRGGGVEVDSITTDRLIRHDVETYVAAIVRRSKERESPFGYTSWVLTFDRSAFHIAERLKEHMGNDAPRSPVMSADFFLNYLALGPLRYRISREAESRIPVLVETDAQEFMPPELLEVAQRARDEARGLPERTVRRRVRDALDAAKQRQGAVTRGGLDGVRDAWTRSSQV
jgi:hypothetical protein